MEKLSRWGRKRDNRLFSRSLFQFPPNTAFSDVNLVSTGCQLGVNRASIFVNKIPPAPQPIHQPPVDIFRRVDVLRQKERLHQPREGRRVAAETAYPASPVDRTSRAGDARERTVLQTPETAFGRMELPFEKHPPRDMHHKLRRPLNRRAGVPPFSCGFLYGSSKSISYCPFNNQIVDKN